MALVVSFAETEPSAMPGGEGVTNVEVTNLGQIVEQVRVEVLGPVGAYTSVEPAELHLYPGTSGKVLLRFKPIAGHMPGSVPFAVRAASTLNNDFTIEEAVLQVGAQTAFSADLRPRQSRARRRARHRVTVFNDGNAPVTVRLAATDPDELLAFKMADSVTIQPGGAAVAKLSARVMAGSPGDIHQFKVFLEDGVSPSVTLDGSVRTRRTPKWPFVAAIAVVGALIAVFIINQPGDPKTGAIELASTESTTTTAAGGGAAAATTTTAAAGGGGGAAGGGGGGGGGGGAATTKATKPPVTSPPQTSPPLTTSPPQTPPTISKPTTATTSASTSPQVSADRLLLAWARGDWADAAKYASTELVNQLKATAPLAGQKTTGTSSGAGTVVVNVACGTTTGRGARQFTFPSSSLQATSFTIC